METRRTGYQLSVQSIRCNHQLPRCWIPPEGVTSSPSVYATCPHCESVSILLATSLSVARQEGGLSLQTLVGPTVRPASVRKAVWPNYLLDGGEGGRRRRGRRWWRRRGRRGGRVSGLFPEDLPHCYAEVLPGELRRLAPPAPLPRPPRSGVAAKPPPELAEPSPELGESNPHLCG